MAVIFGPITKASGYMPVRYKEQCDLARSIVRAGTRISARIVMDILRDTTRTTARRHAVTVGGWPCATATHRHRSCVRARLFADAAAAG